MTDSSGDSSSMSACVWYEHCECAILHLGEEEEEEVVGLLEEDEDEELNGPDVEAS